jgi:hypothetical protein
VLTRLERLDDRVMGLVEVLCRVLVFRSVAASDVPADEAQAQVHPGITCFQTILAALRAGDDVSDLIEVGARRFSRVYG